MRRYALYLLLFAVQIVFLPSKKQHANGVILSVSVAIASCNGLVEFDFRVRSILTEET